MPSLKLPRISSSGNGERTQCPRFDCDDVLLKFVKHDVPYSTGVGGLQVQGQMKVQPGGQMTGHEVVHGFGGSRVLIVSVGLATAPKVKNEEIARMVPGLKIMTAAKVSEGT